MTQAQTPTPEAFPPFTQRPESQEIWRRARGDDLAGDSAPVIAERYSLSERSVRRRASLEGWRRCDVEAELKAPPPWSRRLPKSRADVIAEQPEYREIANARDADAFCLLFNPDQPDFRRLAFRRAAEAAAMNHPAEAAAWLRVLRLLDGCGPMPDPTDGHFRPEDHLRAAMLRALGDHDEDDDDADPDGPAPG